MFPKLQAKQVKDLDDDLKAAEEGLTKIATATAALYKLTEKKYANQAKVDAAKKEVQGLASQVRKNTPKAKYADLQVDVSKAVKAVAEQEKLAAAALKAAQKPAKAAPVDPDAWKQNIVDKNGKVVNLSKFNATFQSALKKILIDKGGNDHGLTMLSNQDRYKHWRTGSERIFGEYEDGKFIFIGYGTHTGNTDKEYDVQLIPSGRTSAMVTKH
jgi:hypothetical protein